MMRQMARTPVPTSTGAARALATRWCRAPRRPTAERQRSRRILEEVAARRCAELANSSYLSLWRPLPGARAAGAEERSRSCGRSTPCCSVRAPRPSQIIASRFRGARRWSWTTTGSCMGARHTDLRSLQKLVVASWDTRGASGGSGRGRLKERTGLPPDGARSSNPMNKDVFEAAVEAKPRAEL
ncbi:unnamed protein product [Prorocentrum cordatum]|uniref:Uncharacterized protein n=1 Tax=Prorocentrum cordatum TaxID=2364126 RepID=A0ABN9RPH6_9DINO|nr:unnamed protein product [Polarella glacialis]